MAIFYLLFIIFKIYIINFIIFKLHLHAFFALLKYYKLVGQVLHSIPLSQLSHVIEIQG